MNNDFSILKTFISSFSFVHSLWPEEVKNYIGDSWRLKLFAVMEQQRVCQRDDQTEKWKLCTSLLQNDCKTKEYFK
jgi:hypothetical protein